MNGFDPYGRIHGVNYTGREFRTGEETDGQSIELERRWRGEEYEAASESKEWQKKGNAGTVIPVSPLTKPGGGILKIPISPHGVEPVPRGIPGGFSVAEARRGKSSYTLYGT